MRACRLVCWTPLVAAIFFAIVSRTTPVKAEPVNAPPVSSPTASQPSPSSAEQSSELARARENLPELWKTLKKDIQDAVEFNQETFTENGWTLKGKKYISPEEKETFEKNIKSALQRGEGNVAQHVPKVAEPDYQVKIEVNPREILENGLRQDGLLEAISLADIDETKKQLLFRTDKPLLEGEKAKIISQLETMSQNLGFTNFFVVLNTPALPQAPSSPPDQPASPSPMPQKSDSVAKKLPETSPPATFDQSQPESHVWEQNLAGPLTLAPVGEYYDVGHRCLLGRLFWCFGRHQYVLSSSDWCASSVYVRESDPVGPASANPRPTSVPDSFWNNEQLVARLIAAFVPHGPEAEALSGNHRTKTILQVSYESVNTPANGPSEGIILPQLSSELFGRGTHLFWQGNYAEALELFEMGLQVNSEDARLWYFKGFSELALNRMDDAERSIITAIVLHEKSANPREIAMALERVQGRFRAVIEKLRPRAALALRTTRPRGPQPMSPQPLASDSRQIR